MSQFSSTNYEIQRSNGTCAATERVMEPGEAMYAALCELTDEEQRLLDEARKAGKTDKSFSAADALGMKRVDVTQTAWDEGYRPPLMFSFWKSTVPEPNEKKKTFVDDAVLMSILLKLGDTEDAGKLAFRHVVSLILLRKKLLRYDGVQVREVVQTDDTGETETVEQDWWQFTPKKDVKKGHFGKWDEDKAFEVLDPKLDESQIVAVTEQLGEVLEADL